MKTFISGLIIGAIIASTITGFAATLKIKTAIFNPAVKLQVDGKAINTEIVTITKEGQANGSNYVSARALAEAMGGTVAWDGKANTIYVTSEEKITATPAPTSRPIPSSYSYSNPAPIGIVQRIAYEDIFDKYTIEAKVSEIVRGNRAWQLIQTANMFNDAPKEGYEYILAKIYFNVLSIDEGKQFNLNSVSFTLVSSIGKDYDYLSVVDPDPTLSAKLYKDASNEGWASFIVAKNDLKPKLAFGRKYDGSGGIWFKAYTE